MIIMNIPKLFYISREKALCELCKLAIMLFRLRVIKRHVVMNVLDTFCHNGFIFNNFQFPHWKLLGNGVAHTSDLSLP